MTVPRKQLISLADTPFYHCISRCVRRAFLCGDDHHSGRCFDHRKSWLVERFKHLADIFAIDICAYAVMSNHYHLVLRLRPEEAAAWSDEEVVRRWQCLCRGASLANVDEQVAAALVAVWRDRLCDVSWYMRSVNEGVARQANAEDGCKGRFWEGRFRSQALLDEAAVLSCMTYVDLNPVRAGLVDAPEEGEFTSIRERVLAYRVQQAAEPVPSEEIAPSASRAGDDWREPRLALAPSGLSPLGPCPENVGTGLDITTPDYLALLDWTGRAIRLGKRGAIPADLPPLPARCGITPESWLQAVLHFKAGYAHAVGHADHLRRVGEQTGRRWVKGVTAAQQVYGARLAA